MATITLNQVKLWPFQATAVREILSSLRAGESTLLVAPTGAGKTVMASPVAQRYRRVVFVAHRREIIQQAEAMMGSNVHAFSIQSVLRHGPSTADLLIIDEAHRAAAKTYRDLIEKYRNVPRLGLTATPLRTDGQGLCDAFSRIIVCSSVSELVDSGHLVPYRAFEAPDEALRKLADVRRRGSDYATGELSDLMNQPRLVGDVVQEYLKHAAGRKAVAFAVGVEHSQKLAEAFRAAGVNAMHIDGRANEHTRAKALADLANGDISVLCNVNLFTEGWDCPPVSCVIMARPTLSLTLYLQCVGRGMRICAGKHDLLILDHAGNIERHGDPNALRQWSLESAAQKVQREAEIGELERLYFLGYGSLEEYELEQKRIRDETYSVDECAVGLGIGPKSVDAFMRKNGIESVARGRYPKRLVHPFIETIARTYSLKECSEIMSVGNKCAILRLGRQGVRPIAFGRYEKSVVDALVAHGALNCEVRPAVDWDSERSKRAKRSAEKLRFIGSTYSVAEVRSLFPWIKPNKISGALVARGISAVRHAGAHARYPKDDVNRLVTESSNSYSSAQCRSMLRQFTQRQTSSYLKDNGIRHLSGDYRRYPKGPIDALVATLRESYSAGECKALLGDAVATKNLSRFLAHRGIKRCVGSKQNTRYAKADIDKLLVALAPKPQRLEQS